MRKMDIGEVTVFLGAALIVCAIVLFIITSRYIDLCEEVANNDSESRIETLISEKDKLIFDNISLQERNDELYDDNVRLSDAIKELRVINRELQEINKELMNPIASKERLPEGVATNRYDCEGYAFPEGTQQARLQNECFTDTRTGARIYDLNNSHYYANGYIVSGYYCVAMGTAYGVDIGDTWFVKLKNGNGFNIILADYQHDISNPDPDDFGERHEYDAAGNIVGPLRNYDGEECVHVLEFIADLDKLPNAAKNAGGMHGLDYFGGKFGDGGNIESIKYLGRKWEP